MMIQDDGSGCHCHGKFQGQGVCAFVYDMDHASISMVLNMYVSIWPFLSWLMRIGHVYQGYLAV